jgi:hypothetical protein
MKPNISKETMDQLQFIFANAIESGRYGFEDFDKFLNNVILHGMIIEEKIIAGRLEEDDLVDIDEVIILSRENMFSEN